MTSKAFTIGTRHGRSAIKVSDTDFGKKAFLVILMDDLQQGHGVGIVSLLIPLDLSMVFDYTDVVSFWKGCRSLEMEVPCFSGSAVT